MDGRGLEEAEEEEEEKEKGWRRRKVKEFNEVFFKKALINKFYW